MKSKILDILFKLKNYDTSEVKENLRYQVELKKAEKPLFLEDIIKTIKKSDKFELFANSMDNIDESVIYDSRIHGITHNERVAIFACAIGLLEKVDENDLKILLEAAKYHDIGRIDDSEDDLHGTRSADLIEKLEDLPEEDLKILKAICTCHSIEDSKIEDIVSTMEIKDHDRCIKLINILKDADALDRVRLRSSGLDTKYLRTESAKRMPVGAYELFGKYESIKHELEEPKLDEFPKEFIDYESDYLNEFTQEQFDFLQKQWTKFNRIKQYDIVNNEMSKGEDGKLILKEGTLIHGMDTYKSEVLQKISESGVLASEFIGSHSDGETFFCANFVRVKEDTKVEDLKESVSGRIPLQASSSSIAFIINPSKEIEDLTDYDAYSPENDDNEIVRNLLNLEDTGIVQVFLSDAGRGKIAAIPVGIPANCFSGIMVGDLVLMDEKKIKELRELFPHCYITTRKGEIIYEPNPEKENSDNGKTKLEILKLNIENDKLKNENDTLNNKILEKKDKYNELMKIVDENCPPEALAVIYKKLGWVQGLPSWLEKKLQETSKEPDNKDEKINQLEETIKEKDLQISKLQKMLSQTLDFANRVRNSRVGKFFFRKAIKALPEGNEQSDSDTYPEK